ncbi:MAG: DUF1800 domain-containing protein [Acidobacteriota bacterium]|nr:DUF1800 domain-containing protein [Acidobacteriota bacterium]
MRLVPSPIEIPVFVARVFAAAVFCLLVVQQSLWGAARAHRTASAAKQIQSDERVLHVLNRFTFGPRAEDVHAVHTLGVERWFERQLNSASIDDSALETRLAMFPAMRMEQAELMQRYPSPQVLRQMIEKGLPLPGDPVEHALYADQIAFYKAVKAKQAAGNADGAVKQVAQAKSDLALPGDGVDPANPGMAAHEEQFYSGLDAVRIINLPPEERMQRILAMRPQELVAFRTSLSPNEMAAAMDGLTPSERETLIVLQGSPRMIGAELLASRMVRDIYSERQLEAVMTDFWLNHFNVYVKKNQDEPYLLPAYERDVIRPRALGKFEDLLVATAQSPAMLMYLDNWQSIGPDSIAARNAGRFAQAVKNPQGQKALKDRGLNENYARELMELHTMGVQCEVSQDHPVSALEKDCGKGYTQADVTEVAKVLTGWTIDRPYRSGTYQFEERRHEPGTKTVLGKKISERGEAEGLEVLHMLATSPATARFISTKLAIRFVSDTPPQAVVDRMTAAFLASDGDIKAVLRAMFQSPEFWSPEIYRAKVKTPEEFVLSAVRASGAEVTNALPLVQSLDRLGMPFYGMQMPNGYSWKAEQWVNTGDLVSRMNFALSLSSNRLPGVVTDWTGLLGGQKPGASGAEYSVGGDEAGVADAAARGREKRLEAVLLGQAPGERTRSTVLEEFRSQQTHQQAEKNFSILPNDQEAMAQLLNASGPKQQARPALDREAATMAGLLLGSPEFQRR